MGLNVFSHGSLEVKAKAEEPLFFPECDLPQVAALRSLGTSTSMNLSGFRGDRFPACSAHPLAQTSHPQLQTGR